MAEIERRTYWAAADASTRNQAQEVGMQKWRECRADAETDVDWWQQAGYSDVRLVQFDVVVREPDPAHEEHGS